MQYRTGFLLRRAKDHGFDDWKCRGCRLHGGMLELDPSGAAALGAAETSTVAASSTVANSSTASSTMAGVGPEALMGEATSPEFAASFPFVSCVPSWNAEIPAGAWLEMSLRAGSAGAWTSWRVLGVWAPDDSTILRHSVEGQDDDEASVATDTLNVARPAGVFQARFRLYATLDATGRPGPLPGIRGFSLAYSDKKPLAADIEPSRAGDWPPQGARGRIIGAVPRCSQMVYPNGGNVWCSPTSVSMVLGYWRGEDGPCETRVRAAVAAVYDHVYKGHGNWSFNAAYAGSSSGMEAYVARFSGLDRLEPWIAAGVPVILSVSWNNDEGRMLSAAPVSRSSGHLTTLVGFDENGDAVMNEPASPSNETVRRVYSRAELETRWLSASGGAAYIIYPQEAGPVDLSRLFASSIG